MGIPSYFSYVSKHHNIVKKIKNAVYTDNLYFDSNSTIYNAIRKLNATTETPHIVIYEEVITQIIEYITYIIPRNTLYVAFDGVAPFAKMKQQRERRHRSAILSLYEKDISKNVDSIEETSFDKASITPGTPFMQGLDKYMNDHLVVRIKQFTSKHEHPQPMIIFSGPMEVGEGEHKLFEYIRKHPKKHAKETTYVYGMDADLIILSLQHSQYCQSIHLFREDLDDHLIELNIQKMKMDIVHEVGVPGEKDISRRITDYVLLSFILGNDFIPHSPVLNIRTNGIKNLLKTYKELVKKHPNFFLTSDKNNCIIQHKHLKMLFTHMAQNEKKYLSDEYQLRNRMQHFRIPGETNDIERSKSILLRIPQINREREMLIQPHHNISTNSIPISKLNKCHHNTDISEWRKVYYEILFRTPPSASFKQKVCLCYISALQWCLSYYTSRCIDTEWNYPYHYPPLFSDLIQYMPTMNCNYFQENPATDFLTSIQQLCYVLPPSSYHLLPETMKERLIQYWKRYGYHYNRKDITNMRSIPLQWEFCTYIWESHPLLPEFPMEHLKTISIS